MKIHPSSLVLEEFLLSLSREHVVLLGHLLGCLRCRRRLQSLLMERSSPSDGRLADLLQWPQECSDQGAGAGVTERLLQDRSRLISQERAEAPGLFVELIGYPREQKVLLLQNSNRFQTWGLFELLIERSLDTGFQNPDYAEELGLVAIGLSDRLEAPIYGPELIEDLRARAWAHIGNARRVKSDLDGAEQAFSKALAHLANGSKDLLERASVMDLEASLRRDQRRFSEAFRLLHRTVAIYLQNGERHRAGRSLLKIDDVYHQLGEPENGIPLLYQALDLIDPEEEPRLLLCARHNLIDDLAECGRYLEAQRNYREARSLYRSFTDAWTQNRRKWVKGKISRGLGQLDQAEVLFLAARQGFIEEGIPFDTALVSLDLALLYARQWRTADLKRLAEEMVPIFSSLHIHREALAALAFLKQAVEAEFATVDLVTRVACYLRKAQHDPELRFEEMVA